MPKVEYIILTGLIMGTLARFYLLKIDFRQYPSYPQGYVIHLTLGAIAAGLGAMVIPALLAKEYTAVTFLTIAIQQFREVRKMERDSLESIDADELVRRGSAYIEDISKRFEARNYAALIVSFLTTAAAYLLRSLIYSAIFGAAIMVILGMTMKSRKISDIADVRLGRIHFEGSFMMIDDIVMMNMVMPQFQDIIQRHGKGIVVVPKDHSARVTLSSPGQRQAILHDVTSILGARKEMDEPELTPIARRDSDTGNVAFFAVTLETDAKSIIEVIKRCPVIETTKKQPLDSYTGRRILKKHLER